MPTSRITRHPATPQVETDDLDVVCGWRYNRHDPLSKKVFSKFANALRKLSPMRRSRLRVHAPAYRRECVNNLELYGELPLHPGDAPLEGLPRRGTADQPPGPLLRRSK